MFSQHACFFLIWINMTCLFCFHSMPISSSPSLILPIFCLFSQHACIFLTKLNITYFFLFSQHACIFLTWLNITCLLYFHSTPVSSSPGSSPTWSQTSPVRWRDWSCSRNNSPRNSTLMPRSPPWRIKRTNEGGCTYHVSAMTIYVHC